MRENARVPSRLSAMAVSLRGGMSKNCPGSADGVALQHPGELTAVARGVVGHPPGALARLLGALHGSVRRAETAVAHVETGAECPGASADAGRPEWERLPCDGVSAAVSLLTVPLSAHSHEVGASCVVVHHGVGELGRFLLAVAGQWLARR